MYSAKDRYTLIEQSTNSKITYMQCGQKNFITIIGNDQKNNGQNFWEILERIIGKISSIVGAGLMHKKSVLSFRVVKESLRMSVVKPLGLQWMIGLYDYLKSKPDIIQNGFKNIKDDGSMIC